MGSHWIPFKDGNDARALGYRWSQLAWARLLQEEERRVLGPDPWPNGLASNRKNLERLVQYSWEQGLIPHPIPVHELFAEDTREL